MVEQRLPRALPLMLGRRPHRPDTNGRAHAGGLNATDWLSISPCKEDINPWPIKNDWPLGALHGIRRHLKGARRHVIGFVQILFAFDPFTVIVA